MGSFFVMHVPVAISSAVARLQKLRSELTRLTLAKLAYAKATASEGGERGIRTLDTLAGITVFETAPIGHSGISPVVTR